MSIRVDEDKLQVFPSKGRRKWGSERKADLRGGLSHLPIRAFSERCAKRFSMEDQKKLH